MSHDTADNPSYGCRTPNADSLCLQTLSYRCMGHAGQDEDAKLDVIPASLRKPTAWELIQDRASELITHHDNHERALEIGNELYELATEILERGE